MKGYRFVQTNRSQKFLEPATGSEKHTLFRDGSGGKEASTTSTNFSTATFGRRCPSPRKGASRRQPISSLGHKRTILTRGTRIRPRVTARRLPAGRPADTPQSTEALSRYAGAPANASQSSWSRCARCALARANSGNHAPAAPCSSLPSLYRAHAL